MNRPRKNDRHLPPCVYEKHGAFWYVKAGKWTRIGSTLVEALEAYAGLVKPSEGGMDKLIDEALAHHVKVESLSKNTQKQYRGAAEILKRKLVEFSPTTLKPKHVAALKAAMAETPNMANRVLSVLRTIFSYAVEWQLVDSNPCIGIKRHAEDNRERLITDAEWWAIHKAAGPRLQVIMELQQLTGQRIGDVLKIRRSQVSEAGIRFKQQKTGKELLVAMTPDMRLTLARAEALSAGKPPALTLLRGRYNGAPDYRSVLRQWHDACTAAKIEDALPNDGRAKAATDADDAGQNATALLGHSSPAMTRRYLRGRKLKVVEGPTIPAPTKKAG